jgi:lysophospholipase L1-like esterase
VDATGRVPVDGRIRWQPVDRRVDGAVVILPEVHGVKLVAGQASAELDPGYYWFTEATAAGSSVLRLVPATGPVAYADLVAVDPVTLDPSAAPDPAWLAMARSTVNSGTVVGDNLRLTRADGTTVDAGNVRGPVGPFNEAATAAAVTPQGAISKAVQRALSRESAESVLYQPSSTSLIKWRGIRGEVLANKRLGHIAVMGDSIPFGAAGTGASSPKWLNSWPGQLRTDLNRSYGDAGSGIVLANPNVRANPTWDPRFTFGGASFLDHPFGLHASTAYRLNGGSDATLDFTATADEFWVCILSSGGTATAQVDAGAVNVLSLNANGTGGTLAREPGYYTNPAGSSHNVFRIQAGAAGAHTLKIRPSATAGQNLFVTWVEARVTGAGKFRVSNVSISGKSLGSLLSSQATDDSNGLYGLPIMDSFRADMLVMGLGVNDWQGQSSLATVRARMESVIDRQRASGANAYGSTYPNGDVVLLWNPKPDVATLGGGAYTNPTWDAYRDLFYTVADAKDVALIDLGSRWRDYATGNAYGMFADTIHPADRGAGDIAAAVRRALFVEA